MSRVTLATIALSSIMAHFNSQPEASVGGFLLGTCEEGSWIINNTSTILKSTAGCDHDFCPDIQDIDSGLKNLGAKAIGIYHNHPLGSPVPTEEDVRLFKAWRHSDLIWLIFSQMPSGLPYARAFQYHPTEDSLIEYLVGISD